MLLKGNQIAAARALLGWDQKDVAERVGLTIAAISKIEKGENKGKSSTLDAIQSAFEMAGITFTKNGGVEPAQNRVVTYKGKDGFADFRADILSEAKTSPLDACVNNVDEREFDKWGEGQVNEDYFAEMQKNKPKRFRILVKENDTQLSASGYAEYRWLPVDKFGEISFFVYGHKTALLSFEDNDFQAFIISHPQISAFYRREFDKLWLTANEPEKK